MIEYTPSEKEKLLMKTAVARDDGVVLLLPEQERLCVCDVKSDAKLVAKLFNNADFRMSIVDPTKMDEES